MSHSICMEIINVKFIDLKSIELLCLRKLKK